LLKAGKVHIWDQAAPEEALAKTPGKMREKGQESDGGLTLEGRTTVQKGVQNAEMNWTRLISRVLVAQEPLLTSGCRKKEDSISKKKKGRKPQNI